MAAKICRLFLICQVPWQTHLTWVWVLDMFLLHMLWLKKDTQWPFLMRKVFLGCFELLIWEGCEQNIEKGLGSLGFSSKDVSLMWHCFQNSSDLWHWFSHCPIFYWDAFGISSIVHLPMVDIFLDLALVFSLSGLISQNLPSFMVALLWEKKQTHYN